MTIESERLDKSTLVMYLNGRLDTATAPQLERKIKQWGSDITELILDFAGLSYISSMGLRVLLQTQKAMNASERKLVIKNMSDSIREVFEMTGFINLMVQEEKFIVIRKEEPGGIRLCLLGQMDPENVPGLAQELSKIRELAEARDEISAVVLDMEKLSLLSAAASRLLRKAITESAFKKRTLTIQNASPEVQSVLEAEGLGTIFEGEESPPPEGASS